MLLASWTVGGTLAATGAEPIRPDVLFLVVDDLRPALSCYGDARARSPHLDRLARHGVLFRRAYCQIAKCGPSRLSMWSGLSADEIGVEGHGAGELASYRERHGAVPNLPRHFREHGYLTRGFGKIQHDGWDDPRDWSAPLMAGRDGEILEIADLDALEGVACAARARVPTLIAPRDGCPAWQAPDVPDEAFFDGRMTTAAIEVLREERDRPLFLAVGFPEDLQLRLIHAYHACVSYVDAQMGRILDAVEETGRREQTVIVLCSDHGWHLGEHGAWGKMTNYEVATRVPLIIAAPGMAAGVGTDALAELTDLYPTVCALAGVPGPGHGTGRSLVPVLRDPQVEVREAARSQFPRFQTQIGRALRTVRYRYVEWTDRTSGAVVARELNDHRDDPDETRNGADGQPEVVARLARQLAGS